MILKKPWGTPLIMAALAAFIQFGPALHAQSAAQSSRPNNNQASNQQQEQQKNQSFVGEIVKAKNGKFALLMDPKAGTGAYLDEQQQAARFEGKEVKVIGTLDRSKALIHVTKIEPE